MTVLYSLSAVYTCTYIYVYTHININVYLLRNYPSSHLWLRVLAVRGYDVLMEKLWNVYAGRENSTILSSLIYLLGASLT